MRRQIKKNAAKIGVFEHLSQFSRRHPRPDTLTMIDPVEYIWTVGGTRWGRGTVWAVFQIITELKRRNVVRVAAAYILVSWVIIQLTALAVPALHMPQWVNSFIFVTLTAGLFIAILVAWAFEVTPEGVRRTRELDQFRETGQQPVRLSDWIMIGALISVIGLFVFDRYREPAAPSGNSLQVAARGSVAVLPFTNLSSETGQQGLSQAFTEDLLNRLTKVSGLRVASRASSFQYGDRRADVSEVGDALSVAAIIEGSVQKVGNRLRINAQLIDVAGGHNLWSDSFDRDANDLLAVQDEVSLAIVAAVRPFLVGGNTPSQDGPAVSSGDPVTLYQAGLTELDHRNVESIGTAKSYFEKAIAADPGYADAYAGIGVATLLLADQSRAYGEVAAPKAIAGARPYIERALALDPGSSAAHAAKGLLELSAGNVSSAHDALERSIFLDPQTPWAHHWKYLTHVASGQRAAGIPYLEAAVAAAPNSLPVALNRSRLRVLQNNRRAADRLIAPLFEANSDSPAVIIARAALQIDGGNRQDALELLEYLIEQTGDPRARFYLGLGYLNIGALDKAARWLTGRPDWLFLARGEPQRALTSARQRYRRRPSDIDAIYSLAEAELASGNFDAVVAILEPFISDAAGKDSEPSLGPKLEPLIMLAVAKKATGDPADADRLLKRASEDLQRMREVNLDNPRLDYLSAGVQAQLGKLSRAYASLGRALAQDFPGRWAVFWDPMFAGIRQTEEFQSLLARLKSEQARDRRNLGIDG